MESVVDRSDFKVLPTTESSLELVDAYPDNAGVDQNVSSTNPKATTNNTANLATSPSKRIKPKNSKDISWRDLNFKVGDKSVLSNCWGNVAANEVCAIMGPSGSGKSSLLNVLAGRSSSTGNIRIEGQVRVGGVEISPVSFRKNIAYVMQDDALMATATPREALRFSATLRLPVEFTHEDIEERVTKVLTDLGIVECGDTMIGGALLKGISGGQRKRTSVGVEVITDPTLLFLDEPTSGLDSFSAFQLVKLLRNIASTSCTILCTIHQPSSEVFFLFDRVIFLKDGQVFYQGSVQGITSFYSNRGYNCPENYNPSDYVMTLCQVDSVEELEKKNLFSMNRPISEDGIKEDIVSSSKQFDSEQLHFEAQSSFLKQVWKLFVREYVNSYRDIPALIGRFGVTIVLNLIFGLIYLNAGGKDNGNLDNFNGHVGAIAMLAIFSLFGSGQSVLLAFPFERPLIMREYVTGTYSLPAYFISKIAVEVPMTFIMTIVQYLLGYFMIDLQGNFIYIVLACFGLGMVSNSIAMLLGCLLPDVKDVTELAPLAYVPQILFGGFFIRTSQIPPILRWAQYLVSMKYAINLIYLTEFDPSLPSCQSSPAAEQNCRMLIENNDINADRYYIYIILLVALFVGFRILGGLVLFQKAKRFY